MATDSGPRRLWAGIEYPLAPARVRAANAGGSIKRLLIRSGPGGPDSGTPTHPAPGHPDRVSVRAGLKSFKSLNSLYGRVRRVKADLQ